MKCEIEPRIGIGGAGVEDRFFTEGFDDNRYLLIQNQVLGKLRDWWEAAAEEGSSETKWKEAQGSPFSG